MKRINWTFSLLAVALSTAASLVAESNAINSAECVITPNAAPVKTSFVSPFAFADFIYWQSGQRSLIYASTGLSNQTNFSIPTAGKTLEPEFSWNPGFKVGGGLNLGHDGWDTLLRYTWLYSSARNSAHDPTGNISSIENPSTQSPATRAIGLTNASIKWHLHLNVWDWELGRSFYLSDKLTLRPHIGLRGVWTKIDWRATYAITPPIPADPFMLLGTTDISGPLAVIEKDKTWGIGPRGGFDTSWKMIDHLKLIANVAFTGLYNETTTDNQAKYFDDGAFVGYAQKYVAKVKTANFLAEFQLGAGTDWWFKQNSYHLGIDAMYEIQVWVDYTQDVTNFYKGSDLYLHGLTARVRFDF